MLELLADLRVNGFKTFIVSGGGVKFIRAFAERCYGIPSEQVVGSYGATRFERGTDSKRCWSRRPRWIACLYGSNCCATVRTDDGSFPTC
jgi:hypothetical protein